MVGANETLSICGWLMFLVKYHHSTYVHQNPLFFIFIYLFGREGGKYLYSSSFYFTD